MLNLLSFLLLPLIGAINSESFPEVLSKEEEDKLIQKLKEKDITARNLLIEHNLRLVAHIVKKFENTKENKDDLLSIGAFGLIKAVDSYNPDNNVSNIGIGFAVPINEAKSFIKLATKRTS